MRTVAHACGCVFILLNEVKAGPLEWGPSARIILFDVSIQGKADNAVDIA